MGRIVDHTIIDTAKMLALKLDDASDAALPQAISDVVKLHAKIAAGLAIIPLPGGDLLASAANVWGMYARINDKLGIKFTDAKLKTIASGLIANLSQIYIGRAILGTILKFVPGFGSAAGAAIDAVMLYSVTITSAYIYMKALIAMAEYEGKDFSDVDTETHFSSIINSILKNDSADIRVVMNDAKTSFKKEDMHSAENLAKEARENGEV